MLSHVSDLPFTRQVTQKPLARRHHFILRLTRSLAAPNSLTLISVGRLRQFDLTAQLDLHEPESSAL
jgi:hypothetical protein